MRTAKLLVVAVAFMALSAEVVVASIVRVAEVAAFMGVAGAATARGGRTSGSRRRLHSGAASLCFSGNRDYVTVIPA